MARKKWKKYSRMLGLKEPSERRLSCAAFEALLPGMLKPVEEHLKTMTLGPNSVRRAIRLCQEVGIILMGDLAGHEEEMLRRKNVGRGTITALWIALHANDLIFGIKLTQDQFRIYWEKRKEIVR